MPLSGPHFTYEDYKLLPEDRRYEIVEGELLVTPAPSARHQGILVRLILRLASFVEVGNLGKVLPAPTDVVLANESVVQPDLLFVARERQGIIDPAGAVYGAPDLESRFSLHQPPAATRWSNESYMVDTACVSTGLWTQ